LTAAGLAETIPAKSLPRFEINFYNYNLASHALAPEGPRSSSPNS